MLGDSSCESITAAAVEAWSEVVGDSGVERIRTVADALASSPPGFECRIALRWHCWRAYGFRRVPSGNYSYPLAIYLTSEFVV